MLPSSSGVYLNRVALEDILGLKEVRRRTPASESPNTAAADPRQVPEAAPVDNCDEPVEMFLKGQTGPDKATHTTSNSPEELENRVHTKKAKRKKCEDSKHEGPYARGKCHRSEPTTKGQDNKNSHPNLSGLAGPEKRLRRVDGASCCGVCSDCKHVYHQWMSLGKWEQKSSSPGPEQFVAESKFKTGNLFTEGSKKIDIWVDQYPKVKLCDVALYCDACRHNCGFLLPDILDTKVVFCFKQDMRAGFRFWPGCLGHDKHKSEECTSFKKSKISPRVQSKECIAQSPSEHQGKMEQRPYVETLSGRPKGWTAEANATNNGDCRNSMWDTESKEEIPGAEFHRNKRIRLGNSINGSLPTTPDLKTSNHDETAKTGVCRGFGIALKENGVHKKLDSQIEPPETEETQMITEVFRQGSKVNTDDSESFTCQRVRAYFRKIKFSCARTYMPWPFSNYDCTLMVNASITDHQADGFPVINQSGALSSLFKSPTDPSSDVPKQASYQSSEEKQNKNGDSILTERNDKRYSCTFSCSPNSTEAELSSIAILSTPSQGGNNPHCLVVAASSTRVNEPETDSSMSTPSLSAPALSDWKMSSSFTQGGFSSLSTTPSFFLLKKGTDIKMANAHSTSASPSSPQIRLSPVDKRQSFQTSCHYTPLHSSDSSQSCESSLRLPQDEQESDENVFSERSSPKLEQCYTTSATNHKYVPTEHCEGSDSYEFMIVPLELVSPLHSPQQYSRTSSLPQIQGCPEEAEVNKDLSKCEMLSEHRIQRIGDGSRQSCDKDDHHQQRFTLCNAKLGGIMSECKTLSTPSSVGEIHDYDKEETWGEKDYKSNGGQGNTSSKQVPLDPKVKATITSAVLTEPLPSPSSDKDDGEHFNNEGQEVLSPSEITGHEGDTAEAAGDAHPGVLDEFTAYEQDILLVHIIQDDAELFKNIPEQSLLKLGPVRVKEASKTRPAGVVNSLSSRLDGASLELKQKVLPVVNFHWDSSDITEEKDRPWRPQSSKKPNAYLATDKETRNMGQSDANKNHLSEGLGRSRPIHSVSSSHNIPPLMTVRNGSRITNLAEFRQQKSNAYCRHYFSESLSCGFKMCRFQHVPMDGDEKFCVATVMRFTKNPTRLKKAGAVFTGYYQNNPPGVYFSMPVLLSLLWSLLKAGMVSDVISVLGISLAHNLVPSDEFLLALFNYVREKGIVGLVPELVQLTLKMVSAGLVLSLHCLDYAKNSPEFQHTVHAVSGASVESCPEYLNLMRFIVEIELCAKQGDWRTMGEVFSSMCQLSQHANQVERISGRIAIALLSESKDKLPLPFVTFAETARQRECDDGLNMSFLGRIGVSLMLRYCKRHQWSKGQRVVEVLIMSKVNYSTLKGLFGNEDRASRCCLITVAAELFLMSGSVEGALNVLRENNWFLSSPLWPCEPADLESRTRVLIHLTENTSHRDTLEVLCNLPGMKEPIDMIDISRHSPLFNYHLKGFVDRQILPVASDSVDFMLSRKLPVDHRLLQILVHKLGKKNLWLRAREVFRHALRVGYYQNVSAPTGVMSLMVPCMLGEVELALTFEMFITVNASAILHLSNSSTSCLSITLKRIQSCESEYLSAGSRVLYAACIPQPKLTVQYTAVNASQEQVFTLDISSAQRWLRCNHLWANELWMQ